MTKMTQTAAPDVTERVQALVEEVLAGSPHFIVELEVRGAPGSQAVDVFIDSDEGLGVDTLAEISREVAFLVEAEEVIAGHYRLNVSSPGVDRPLKLPRQYKKNVGRTLRVHYQKPEGDGYTETLGELAIRTSTMMRGYTRQLLCSCRSLYNIARMLKLSAARLTASSKRVHTSVIRISRVG